MYLVYDGTFSRIRTRYFGKILERLALPPTAKVLDYGCGPGDFLLAAKAYGITAIGFDSSPRSAKLAAERGLSVRCGASAAVSFAGERFDAIVVQSVLEHVHDGVQLVTELREMLVPGGILVLSAPTPGPFFWDDPTHVRPYTPRSFVSLAQIVSLECTYVSYVFAFLLGLEIRASVFFQLMNIIPASLGSNLIALLRKTSEAEPAAVLPAHLGSPANQR